MGVRIKICSESGNESIMPEGASNGQKEGQDPYLLSVADYNSSSEND